MQDAGCWGFVYNKFEASFGVQSDQTREGLWHPRIVAAHDFQRQPSNCTNDVELLCALSWSVVQVPKCIWGGCLAENKLQSLLGAGDPNTRSKHTRQAHSQYLCAQMSESHRDSLRESLLEYERTHAYLIEKQAPCTHRNKRTPISTVAPKPVSQ